TIDADWIEDIETLEERLRDFTAPKERFDPFKTKYAASLAEEHDNWRAASAVIARGDVERILSTGWGTARS
ncbi:MAG: hypothetical protein ACRYG4_24940, partial [Janthinobacterium lividum]